MTIRTVTFDDAAWQLVPRIPTPMMLYKGLGVTSSWLDFAGSRATVNQKKMMIRYRAMLAAVPSVYFTPPDWHPEHEVLLAEEHVDMHLPLFEKSEAERPLALRWGDDQVYPASYVGTAKP